MSRPRKKKDNKTPVEEVLEHIREKENRAGNTETDRIPEEDDLFSALDEIVGEGTAAEEAVSEAGTEDIPEFMKGLPITLIAAALCSLSFLGFAGIGG